MLQAFEAANDLAIFDLDDIDALRMIGIRKPTEVVTRDRKRTRGWARKIYELRKFAGAAWWCYYNPDWKSFGLWNIDGLEPVDKPEVLTVQSASVRAAAAIIVRQLVGSEFSSAPPRSRR